MAKYFGIPLDDEYRALIAEGRENLHDPDAPPQNEKALQAAQIFIHSMLNVIIYDLCDQVEIKPFAEKVVRQLGKLMEKTTNILLDKVISKLSNEELVPLVEYLENLELDCDGNLYMSILLSDKVEDDLDRSFACIESKDVDKATKHFRNGIIGLAEASIHTFLIEMMGLLNLGFLTRKIVDLSAATLQKAIPPAIRKTAVDLSQTELESFQSYLDQFLLET